MPGQFVPRAAAVALAALGLLTPFGQAGAQEATRDCTVQKEPSGMVRGDRVPSGCLLFDGRASQPAEAAAGLFVSREEVIAYTPTYTRVLLENCVRLCDGRPVIPIAAFGAGQDGRGFMPTDRHFEPLLRPFEPLKRPFGSLDHSVEPLERPFGSCGPQGETERRPGGRR